MLSRIIFVSILLIMIPSLIWAESNSFEGQGEAQIAENDLVSARKKALMAAQQDAVIKAVATWIGPYKQIKTAGILEKQIYSHFVRYIQTYRVIAEMQQLQIFIIRVTVVLDTKRLQRDVRKIIGGGGEDFSTNTSSSNVIPSPILGLWIHSKLTWGALSNKQISHWLRSQLEAVGYTIVDFEGATIKRALSLAQKKDIQLLLATHITVRSIDGVRGLDLLGAEAKVMHQILSGRDGKIIFEQAITDLAARETLIAAEKDSVLRALSQTFTTIKSELQKKLPAPASSGTKLFRISNLTTYDQFQVIQKTLIEKLDAVHSCIIKRISKGEVWFEINSDGSTRELAGSLETQAFPGFVLKINNLESDSVWLKVTSSSPSPN